MIQAKRGPAPLRVVDDGEKAPPAPAAPLGDLRFEDPEAQAEWERVTAELAKSGRLGQVDQGSLVMLCKTYARWVRLDTVLDAEGEVIKGERGPRKHPAWQLWRESLAAYLAIAKEVGVTRSSRHRLGNAEVQPDAGADLWG